MPDPVGEVARTGVEEVVARGSGGPDVEGATIKLLAFSSLTRREGTAEPPRR